MLPAHIFSSFSDTLRIIKDPSQIKKKKLPIGIMLRRNRLRWRIFYASFQSCNLFSLEVI